jgi:hypothetical protein
MAAKPTAPVSTSLPVSSVSPAPGGPATARHDGILSSLCDVFLRKANDQFFIDTLVDEMVEKACDIHVDRVLGSIAVEYTACALWAEMVHLIASSVVPVDEGYRSTAELAVSEGSRAISEHHHDPWRPDVPAARIITEEHSRRVVDLRPAKVEAPLANGRRRRVENSRPTSSQSSQQVDDGNARALLSRGSLKPGSRGSIDLGATQTMRVTANSGPSPKSTRVHHAKHTGEKGHGLGDTHAVAQVDSLSQPDYVTDETEVKQHQDGLAQIAADREESQKKAARIARTLSDPKTAPKNFTIDKLGNVIPLMHVDDNRVNAQFESLSPRFIVPQQPAPQPPQEVTISSSKGRGRSTYAATKPGGDEKKRPQKEGEGFISTDARDVPMQIKVAPSGGVTIKEVNQPQRTAELKTPATKLSRQEFLRLRGTLGQSEANQAFAEQPTASRDTEGNTVIETGRTEGNASEVNLPSKRPPQASASKGVKEPAQAQSARKPQSAALTHTVIQAPAPPPKREPVSHRAVNTRKMQIEKFAPTKTNDKQLATLADTWQGQRVANEERSATRVTVATKFDPDDDLIHTM